LNFLILFAAFIFDDVIDLRPADNYQINAKESYEKREVDLPVRNLLLALDIKEIYSQAINRHIVKRKEDILDEAANLCGF
jgi:hypothetical protein